jgi:RNA polymerase sigma factor (sigma-70 family)
VFERKRASELAEQALIARVSARDLSAFDDLYRLYRPRLIRFLSTLVQRSELVEEVLDDTMVVLWQHAADFRGASRLSTWVFGIAYRKALRTRARWPEPSSDAGLEGAEGRDPLPDSHVMQSKVHEALLKAMQTLSAEHRAVVDLTYFHELGYREIAEVMDCPVNTVKTRMLHARRRLRQALGGSFTDWM